jgi:hypothetical protein
MQFCLAVKLFYKSILFDPARGLPVVVKSKEKVKVSLTGPMWPRWWVEV